MIWVYNQPMGMMEWVLIMCLSVVCMVGLVCAWKVTVGSDKLVDQIDKLAEKDKKNESDPTIWPMR